MATKKQTKVKVNFPQIDEFIFIDSDGDEITEASSIEELKENLMDEYGAMDGFIYKKVPVYEVKAECQLVPVKKA